MGARCIGRGLRIWLAVTARKLFGANLEDGFANFRARAPDCPLGVQFSMIFGDM